MPSFTSIVSILAIAAASVAAYKPVAEYAAYPKVPSKSVEKYVPSSTIKAENAHYTTEAAYKKPEEVKADPTYISSPVAKPPVTLITTTAIATPTVIPVQGNCNVNSSVSCCNTDGAVTGNDLLGGSCFLNLPALGTNCETGSAYCCETNQVGLINTNLACSPIDVL